MKQKPLKRNKELYVRPLTKYSLLTVTLLYFCTAIYINLPLDWAKTAVITIANLLPEKSQKTVKITEFNIRKLAHIIGADNIWRMFSSPVKELWTLKTIGNFEKEGKKSSLVIDAHVHKDNTPKAQYLIEEVHKQLLTDKNLRQNYTDYLSHLYKTRNFGRLESVSFAFVYQPIQEPKNIVGCPLSNKKQKTLIDTVKPTKTY